MGLISEKLNNKLNELIGKCFSINRMLDRGMSLLMVRWKMIRSSTLLHPAIAHAYPSDKFADSISDYQGQRDNESIYPSTPIGNKNYDNPLEFFKDYHKENLELEDMIKDAIDEAVEEGDLTTKKFLDGLLERLVPYTAMSQTLIDLATQYGTDSFHMQLLDANIKKYINV
jgi:ferritin